MVLIKIKHIMKRVLFIFLILRFIVACQDTMTGTNEKVDSSVSQVYASVEYFTDTKTNLDMNNNIIWSPDDELVAFMKTTLPSRYKIDPESAGTHDGRFTVVNKSISDGHIETGAELNNNVILYPYSELTSCYKADDNSPEKSYVLDILIPEVQDYKPSSFDDGSFPMVAVSSDNRFSFKNICGAMLLSLKGYNSVKSIILKGCNNEPLSGAAEVIAYTEGKVPSITMDSEGGNELILNCPEPVKLNSSVATPFIISVVPTTFKNGMSVTIIDEFDNTYEFTNSSENEVKRSVLLKMPVIELGYVDVEGVELDHTELTLIAGSKFVLKPVFTPLHPSNTLVTWHSDNQTVATVASGEVTAHTPGIAVITVTTDDGGFTATCKLTVKSSGAKPDEGGLEGTEDEDLNI